MKLLKLQHTSQARGVSPQEIKDIEKKLEPEIERIGAAINAGHKTEYASVALPSDQEVITQVNQIVAQKKKSIDPKAVLVIGVGGSNLGTIAVHEALNGSLFNEFDPEVKLYFVDSVDVDHASAVMARVQHEFKTGNNVLLNVVTKSGTTTETIVNFELFLELFKKQYPQNWKDYIVITTGRDSKLWDYAREETIETLEIPEQVGGRFSVFSPVSLFPLAFVGIDIDTLCAGAKTILQPCVETNIENNPAALSAATVYAQYRKGCVIHNTFIFDRNMRAIGDWYRQLVGESLGKKVDTSGKVVHSGITPTTSIGTNDLHSVFQLYLAGPRNRFTTFVTIQDYANKLVVPEFKKFDSLVANIQGRTVADITQAIIDGVQRAYSKDKRPFIAVEFPEKSAAYLGQFLQMKMVEIMYLGFLININPFNQPQVELYKKETREILAKD